MLYRVLACFIVFYCVFNAFCCVLLRCAAFYCVFTAGLLCVTVFCCVLPCLTVFLLDIAMSMIMFFHDYVFKFLK